MNGETLRVETLPGEGPPLVMLHGWGAGREVWRQSAERLAANHRVLLLDLPGYGMNRDVASATTLPALASQLQGVIPPGAVWIGWSLGGMVALAATGSATPPTAVVMVASTPRFVHADDWPDGVAVSLLQGFADALQEDAATLLQRFFALQSLGSEAGRDELRRLQGWLKSQGLPSQAGLTAGLQLLRGGDLRPGLASITMPLLLLHGTRDRLIPPTVAEASARMSGANLAWIEGAGHAPFLSHPELFHQQLQAWLATLPEQSNG